MECVFDEKIGDYVYSAEPLLWSVREVVPSADYTLMLVFSDGTTRRFDFKPLLSRSVYERLNDVNEFMRATAAHGTVDWGNDLDVAPEYLYENSTVIE